jgi:hypothetical protein
VRSLTVREAATVIVTETVDGTVQRRTPRKGQRAAYTNYHIKVDPRVWAVARKLCGPYQAIKIIDTTTVLITNQKEACHG